MLLRSAMLLATAVSSGFGTPYDDDWPPARFEGLGTTIVVFATQDQINNLCGTAPEGKVTDACSNDQRIVMPNPCLFDRTEIYARFACHELAHRFGNWPGSHPQ